MPKIKSHSGAKKRFKRTATGKWLHKRAGARHLLIGMSAKRGRFLRRKESLTRTEAKTMDKYLPYG